MARKRDREEAERRAQSELRQQQIRHNDRAKVSRAVGVPPWPAPAFETALVYVRCSHMGYTARSGLSARLWVRGKEVHVTDNFSTHVLAMAGDVVTGRLR